MNIDTISDLVTNLGPGALTIVACIVIGYVLRGIKSVNNAAIPIVCLIVGGTVYPLLIELDKTQPHPAVRAIIVGVVLGFIAWNLHDKILSKIEDKIPGLSSILARGEAPPATPPSTDTTVKQENKP